LSDISWAAVEVIWPYRFVWAIFYLTCLEIGDDGSILNDEFSVNSAWCSRGFLFSSIILFQGDHNPHETVSAGSHYIFEFPGPFSICPYKKTKHFGEINK